jgi:aquaporin Z
MAACFMTEILATFFFLFIMIGTTSKGRGDRFRWYPHWPRAHVDPPHNDSGYQQSVNPARGTGLALFAGSAYVGQFWLFWLAPIVGAVIAGLLTRWLYEREATVDTRVVEERRVR